MIGNLDNRPEREPGYNGFSGDDAVILRSRDEWNIAKLYAEGDHDEQIQADLEAATKASQDFAEKWTETAVEGALREPEILKEALDEYDQWLYWHGPCGYVDYYVELRRSQDSEDSYLEGLESRTNDVISANTRTMDFFTRAIQGIPKEDRARLLEEPSLHDYRHFLEQRWIEAEHLLEGESESTILALKQGPAYRRWKELTAGLLSVTRMPIELEDGHVEEKGHQSLIALTKSKVKVIRDRAGKALDEIFAAHGPIATKELNAILDYRKIEDEKRRYERPDSQRLETDEVSPEFVDTLMDSVASNYHVANRFYRLKAKLLGDEQLEYHERNVEIGEVGRGYSVEEALATVYDAYVKFDPAVAEIFKGLVEDGRIDFFPREKKVGGAYCYGEDKSPRMPTYMLLNFAGTIGDIVTMAHEGGHAIHNELSRGEQKAINYRRPMSTAEVASTFMEDYVYEELASGLEDEDKLALMVARIDNRVNTIFRQVALYQFEREIHEGFKENGNVSMEEIGSIFQKHMSNYMGEAVAQSPGSENWWTYIPHIRNYFYVYSYASGALISQAMRKMVKNDSASKQVVIDFFAAGSSGSPEELFDQMGIKPDKDFWQQGIAEIEEMLSQTEQLALSLGKV